MVLGLGGALARASPPSARTSEARARRTRPRPTPYPRISSRRGAPRADPRPRARVFAPPSLRALPPAVHPAPWTSGACSAGIDARDLAPLEVFRAFSVALARARSRDARRASRARRARNPPRWFARGARSPALTQSSRPSTSSFPSLAPFPPALSRRLAAPERWRASRRSRTSTTPMSATFTTARATR